MNGSSALQKYASKRDLADALHLIDAALATRTQEQFADLLRLMLKLLPVQGVSVGLADLSDDGAILRNERKMSIALPDSWAEHYRRSGFGKVDPIAKSLFSACIPMFWSQVRRSNDSRLEKAFYGDAAAFGLRDGFSYGARLNRASKGSFFTCSGGDLARQSRHRALLNHIAPHLHMAFCRVYGTTPTPQVKLTPRELEALGWARHGKTNWEISVLMTISERSAKFHIENAMRKVNASNRTQAIATALALGLLGWD